MIAKSYAWVVIILEASELSKVNITIAALNTFAFIIKACSLLLIITDISTVTIMNTQQSNNNYLIVVTVFEC